MLVDRNDYDWAAAKISEHGIAERCSVLFSPATGALQAATLADWILEDRLPVRFQMQLQKVLWGDEPGR